jgi:hypothetical protein
MEAPPPSFVPATGALEADTHKKINNYLSLIFISRLLDEFILI